MRKTDLFLVIIMLLTLCACHAAPPSVIADTTTVAPTETPTAAPTQVTQAPIEPSAPALQPMDLVGSWQRVYSEIEGDRVDNTNATITIAGDAEDRLTITYHDKEFPDTDFREKALRIRPSELYTDCGNDWVADVADTGKDAYSLTLLEDGTLVLQCGFDYDGQPMVSYQWFAHD